MSTRFSFTLAAFAAAGLAFSGSAANAATTTVSDSAPATDGEDVANWAASTGTDKWFPEVTPAGQPKGQTITPSSNVQLNSLTYQIADNQQAPPTKDYTIRVSTVDRVDPGDPSTWTLTEVHSETATQASDTWAGPNSPVVSDGEQSAMPYMTWSLDSPVTLSAGQEYGIDVAITNTTSGWRQGIPYLKRAGDEYADGTRYFTGGESGDQGSYMVGDSTMDHVDGDMLFHADLSSSEIPEPASLALFGMGGLMLLPRRRRA
jgi:hypothetical protein